MNKGILFLLLALPLAAAGCGSGYQKSAVIGDMSANLPMGLPLMKGTAVVMNNKQPANSNQKNATATLTSAESRGDVVQYYADALEQAGFEGVRQSVVSGTTVITAQRGNAIGMLTVKENAGKSNIAIVVRDE